MDETPMNFDMVPNRTINKKGENTVSVRTRGAEKRHLTVVLTCTASGEVPPSMVIFKKIREVKVNARGMVVTVQPKGWMDDTLMSRYIKEIFVRHVGQDSLLVMDSFRFHISAATKKVLRRNKITSVIIPGGCSGKVQPLDVAINKPYKSVLRKLWSEWMASNTLGDGTRDRIKAADYHTVVDWVAAGWEELKKTQRPDCEKFPCLWHLQQTGWERRP
ncbi:hypothetical protein BaRGS_00035835 [Batillaria attramentaria]|uniref:DDE-1 domain-containing protein n=1 Tax=Batillaria attramentaria TaxID=370345 RepID=A0ABD0JDB4_9CAEN